MTKKQAKIFARIYSASMVSYIDAFCFMDNNGNMFGIPENDQQKMIDACIELSNKIQGTLPDMSEAPVIYKYVIDNF